MNEDKISQVYRILSMYERLKNGETLVKKEEAARFKTSEKTIQRDLQSIRDFLEKEDTEVYVDYDRSKQGYVLNNDSPRWLKNEEIFAFLKVLIESRAFPKKEMNGIIDKLTSLAKKEDQYIIKKMMENEKNLYVDLYHKKNLIQVLWQLSLAIQKKKIIYIDYKREFDVEPKRRELKPVGILFSEFYFYLIAYSDSNNFEYPIIYRVDRIEHFEETEKTFKKSPFEFKEGDFRKKIQFMYSGNLIKVRFKFSGPSPQAVIDRLPTAQVIKKEGDAIIFEAEVFGKGIKMWLLSQGKHVEILYPEEFKNEFIQEINEMYHIYNKTIENDGKR